MAAFPSLDSVDVTTREVAIRPTPLDLDRFALVGPSWLSITVAPEVGGSALFADIGGSTALAGKMTPTEYRLVLIRFYTTPRSHGAPAASSVLLRVWGYSGK